MGKIDSRVGEFEGATRLEHLRQLAPARRFPLRELRGRIRDVREPRRARRGSPAPRASLLSFPRYLCASTPGISRRVLRPPVERAVSRVRLIAVHGDDGGVGAVDGLLAGPLRGPNVQKNDAHTARDGVGVPEITDTASTSNNVKSGDERSRGERPVGLAELLRRPLRARASSERPQRRNLPARGRDCRHGASSVPVFRPVRGGRRDASGAAGLPSSGPRPNLARPEGQI